MASAFKRTFAALFLIACLHTAAAQVSINVSVKPPFTPFISDYTNPARLQDISLSLFNQSGNDLRLKFKLTLVNPSKGIRIAIKESATPTAPLELLKNEFKFVVLEDVSNLYGKLDQNSFDIAGAEIQNLILDGTIPDGIYELCLQAFDFDAPGFSKPLSGSSPSGCFTFQVNYTDPPTDIRFNNNLLQYSFGGAVPKIGVNKGLGQNYSIQFTPPALNPGSQYEYELMVFSEEVINPTRQRENSLLTAIETIMPLIRKTSSVPFFVIDPSDLQLDFGQNYFLLIKAIDLNEKTLFKNKGFSTFKAFHMVDVEPLFLSAPVIKLSACGKEIAAADIPANLFWDNGMEIPEESRIKNLIETRIKIARFNSNVIPPDDVFASVIGQTLLDTVFTYAQSLKMSEILAIAAALRKPELNLQTRWVLGVHHRIIEPGPLTSFIQFANGGKGQCVFQVGSPQGSAGRLLLTVDYPQNNDTLPFHYPPVVVKTDNLSSANKVVFTQFNSGLEFVESNKYLKLSTDPNVNTEMNALGLDTALSQVARLLDKAARLQLLDGNPIEISDCISSAVRLLGDGVSEQAKIQIAYALNSRNLPLGNGASGKIALLQQLLKFEAAKQLTDNQSVMRIPNIERILYIRPYRDQVLWSGRVGVYSDNLFYNAGMSMQDFELKFRRNSFNTDDMATEMLKQGLKTASGSFSVGMKTPQLKSNYNGRELKAGKVIFSFLTSPQPQKLLPSTDNNDAWREFEFLSVSQQWNFELAKDPTFVKIDTVISQKIVKNYDIRKGTSEIVADLYKDVNLSLTLLKPGKYYWRVTWSNVTADHTNSPEERAYYIQLGNLLAASQLLGEDINTDSLFLIRQNYRISRTDSFVIGGPKIATAAAPDYELIYPLNGDTIPFLYPPLVIRRNKPDTAYKFVLSKFNSNLEPFVNHNYYLLDSQHSASRRLKQLSYDSSHRNLIQAFDAMAKEQLYGDKESDGLNSMLDGFASETIKKSNLQFYTTPGSDLLVLGNSPAGKLNLSKMIASRYSALQQSGNNTIDPEKPDFGQLIYLKPYKSVLWNARFAFFAPAGETVLIDSFEKQFSAGLLDASDGISANNQQGLGNMGGQFSVGMKTPELQPLSGKIQDKTKIRIRFRPSMAPLRVFPVTDNNQAWAQWQELMVAQQWNLEVSKTRTFDSLVYRRSKCIVETYSLPGSKDRLVNELYTMREEVIRLDTVGKFYYRITWSNPSDIDTSNALHLRYMAFQNHLQRLNGAFGQNETDQDDAESFRELERVNYRFSAIDSFMAADSSVSADTAECGLGCSFAMNGINMTPQTGHIKSGDVVKVGQFDMKIRTISFNTTSKTASGAGSIRCNLFPGPIAVVFSNVKFNADKRLVEGAVKAKTKTDDLISGYADGTNTVFKKIFDRYLDYTEVKNRVNSAVDNATEGTIEDLYSYINSPACLILGGILGEEVTMPFGLSKEVDNFPHTIAVTDMLFTPTDAKFSAAAILRMTYGAIDQFVGFGASELCLTPKGLGQMSNGAALELMGSLDFVTPDTTVFRILGRLGDSTGNAGQSGTRLVWDCKGFKHIDLKVSLEMNRKMMQPVAGKTPLPGKVTATGHAVVSSFNNFLLSLDFDKSFQLSNLPGFVFTCRQATLDVSDLANAQGMSFPANYLGERNAHWKGIYLQELGLRLPDAFSEKDTVNGLSILARNVIIDAGGISASIRAENVLAISSGSMAGWKYGIDTVAIDIVNNVPRNTRVKGRISVPVLNGELAYGMLLHPSKNGDSLYAQFGLSNTAAAEMPAWFATLSIAAGSRIDVIGDISRPRTLSLQSNLNGSITLGSDNIGGLKDVRLGTLPFEGLKVKTAFANSVDFSVKLDKLGGMDMNRVISNTQLPNASAGSTSPPAPQTSGQQKTGGFPINISDIGMDAFSGKCTFDLMNVPGARIGVTFKISVNIADLGNNSIGGSCKLGIYAAPQSFNSIWEFKPAGLNVDTIRIAADLNGAIKVVGGIAFIANDPVYGNGVAGFLMADIKPTIAVGVSGMFGEVNGMRYWMFGAFAKINPGIPIDFSANVLYANSISAEAWYKMSRTSGDATAQAAGFQIGRSPSGASFLPDNTKMFGFGAALGLTGPPGTPLFGDVGLYATINDNGGLSLLTMEGNIWMTNDDKATAPVLVNCNANIDIDNEKFTANMTALVNVAGGIVKGRTPITVAGKTYFQAGSGSLLIDVRHNNWYIKLGDPFVTDGKMGFGFYAGSAEVFKAGGYFMMGNNLPQSLPPMDAALVSKLREAGILLPAQRSASSNTGFAILMGMDASIPEKKIELGFFYAGLRVQFATDGLLAPSTLNCAGRDGMKGWYMTGKAYAVVNGALGMHVDLPMYKGDIIAVTLNAGMVLDAGLPNPYFFKGQFSANYSVLGGLIEGNKRVEFELAEDARCKPAISAQNAGFSSIVADSRPAAAATNVSVGVEPTIALNFALDKETKFFMPTPGKPSVPTEVKIRVRREYIRLLENNSRNRKINVLPSEDGLTLTIRPDSFLKGGNAAYKLSAKFFVEKYNSSTKLWEKVLRTGTNRPWDTLMVINFTSEEVPVIQPDYISYSTPLSGENFFKKGDYSIARIVFKQNNVQASFFTGTLRTTSPFRDIDLVNGYNVYYGQYAVAGVPGDTQRVSLSFLSNEVRFALPAGSDTSKLYQFRIIRERIPGQGLVRSGGFSYTGSEGTFQRRTIVAADKADRRTISYSFNFKISKFRTFSDKIKQLQLSTATYTFTASDTIRVIAKTREPFEEFELKSYVYPMPSFTLNVPPPLVLSCSNNSVDDNAWMRDFYRPRVYKAGDSLQRRRTSLASVFTDRTKNLVGVLTAMNAHVFKPLPSGSFMFNYDFRLTDLRLTNLNVALLSGSIISGSLSSSLNLDLQTNTLSSSSTSTTTTSTAPAIGSQLHFNYFHYMLMANDFNRLKSLANTIVASSPTLWYLGFTNPEIALINRVRSSTYVFQTPFNTNKFAIALHRNSNNTAPQLKLFINSNRIDLQTIATMSTTSRTSSTTFSTFTRI